MDLTFGNTRVRVLENASYVVVVCPMTRTSESHRGLCPSCPWPAISQRPQLFAQLTEPSSLLCLTEMLVLSQKNKEDILTVRECFQGFLAQLWREDTLFLSVQWGPVEARASSVMRSRPLVGACGGGHLEVSRWDSLTFYGEG